MSLNQEGYLSEGNPKFLKRKNKGNLALDDTKLVFFGRERVMEINFEDIKSIERSRGVIINLKNGEIYTFCAEPHSNYFIQGSFLGNVELVKSMKSQNDVIFTAINYLMKEISKKINEIK